MIAIYGASGHGGMILEILEKENADVIFFDDDISKNSYLDHKVIHELDESFKYVIGIGDNGIRKKVASKNSDLQFTSAISQDAILSKLVDFAEGVVVFPGAVVNHSVFIGAHSIINTKASVDHDCKLGSFVHVAPGATICGGVIIGNGTFVGAGATILPNLEIGDNVVIGAGAVVTNDIASKTKVVGIPAKAIYSNG